MVLEGIVLSDKGQSAQDMFQLYNILKSDKTIQLEKTLMVSRGQGWKGSVGRGAWVWRGSKRQLFCGNETILYLKCDDNYMILYTW